MFKHFLRIFKISEIKRSQVLNDLPPIKRLSLEANNADSYIFRDEPEKPENAGIGNLVYAVVANTPARIEALDKEIDRYQKRIKDLINQKRTLKAGCDAMTAEIYKINSEK
jgi:chaperonin cofactor prefoldin